MKAYSILICVIAISGCIQPNQKSPTVSPTVHRSEGGPFNIKVLALDTQLGATILDTSNRVLYHQDTYAIFKHNKQLCRVKLNPCQRALVKAGDRILVYNYESSPEDDAAIFNFNLPEDPD